jgi:hypothetical protein
MRKFIFIVLLFIAIVGCAPWMQVGGLYTSDSYNFSVELPQGWMRSNTVDYLLITRDGTLLQSIVITRLDINKELKNTKKKFKKDMLPQEAAEVIIDNTASDSAILNFEVLENSPAKISGFPGFKLVATNKNKDGLKYKSIYYGFITGEWFYGIRYTAAQRHYFDKDIKTFEKVFESFKLIKIA